MRKVAGGCLVLGLLVIVVIPARSDDQADVQAIVDKAIKATGGADKLAKYKAAIWKGKGKINLMGNEIDFTVETATQPPKQSRQKSEADFNGMKFERITVVNGDKGWITIMGNTDVMPDDQMAAAKEELYGGWVSGLLAPLKDPAFKLAPLGEIKVGDRPAVGVKVSHKEHKDVNLYFDKDKGLLLKVQRRVKDMGGQDVDQETIFSDYQEESGIQRPRKQKTKRDGNDFLEIQITEFKSVDKLDESTFAKP